MSDKQWENLVNNIARSDEVKRRQWASQQPPLLASLDARDAEDDPNHVPANKGP